MSSQLVFPGPEGPGTDQDHAVRRTLEIGGARGSETGDPRVVPLAVQIGPDFASAVTWVRFGRVKGAFLVDTGSSQSAVTPKLAQTQDSGWSARRTVDRASVGTLQFRCCVWTMVRGSFSTLRSSLALQSMPGGLDGIFGADQLSRFSFAVLAFGSGELLVGPTR